MRRGKRRLGKIPRLLGLRWARPAPGGHGRACEPAHGQERPRARSVGQRYAATPSALREGEVAVELPARFDASLYFIGRIHTPWKQREDCPKNARESDAVCTIELDPRWVAGLKGLETAATSWCSTGWTRRGATSCCRRRGIMPSSAAPSRCARRCGPIRSPFAVARLLRHRRQHALGRRPRLPGRHAAPRHQALFRLDRLRARRRRSAGTPTASAELFFPPPARLRR